MGKAAIRIGPVKRRRHARAVLPGEPVRLMGTMGRTPLLSLTAVAAAVLLGFMVLALPGDPSHARAGVKNALQDPRR